MDHTLRDYLTMADAAHEFCDKYVVALSVDVLEEKITSLQTAVRNIQSVAKRIADVSNIMNQYLLHRKSTKTRKYIDPYPTENDHAVMRIKYPLKTESKEVIEGISLPIRVVSDVREIPLSHIYYIEALDQYAINIGGVIIKGGLSNIVEYQTEKSARCEYGIECKSFVKNKPCKYFHDVEDYIKLGLPIPKNHIRNFTVGSWLYSQNKRPKTYFTRHVGSRATLLGDLASMRKIQYREEINNREGQLIHDLLIYMILHNKGLLERYKFW